MQNVTPHSRDLVKFAAVLGFLFTAACERQVPDHVPTASPARQGGVQIHGHRGARAIRPENTLPAFEAALDLEVDVLELDLQLSRDDVVVVWHDPYIQAKTCRVADAPVSPPVDLATIASSLTRDRPLDAPVVDPDRLPPLHPALAVANQRADQLRKLRCDRNPNPDDFPAQQRLESGDYGVVSLDELFTFVKQYAANPEKTASQRANAAKVQFNIELKRSEMYPTFVADRFDGKSPALFENATFEVLRRHGVIGRTIVQSFDHRSLWAFRELTTEVQLAALQREGQAVDLVQLRASGATIWSPAKELATPEAIGDAHAAGLLVVPWTINDPALAKRLISAGVDGLITDDPAELRKLVPRH